MARNDQQLAVGVSRVAMVEVKPARTTEQIEQVRELFREYQTSLGIDLDFQGFAEEVVGLPGSYAPPSGRLLLLVVDEIQRGCVALQQITSETCEMKRLYVQPGQRGTGLGRLLVACVLDEARSIGYRRICLDTLPSMTRAQAMYLALGFEEVQPYRHNPVPGTRYMARSL
jgi:GNAT superfamily N-acetyltransferase